MIQPRLKARSAVPFGGLYQLNLPDKGMVGRGTALGMLLDNIKAYRRANGIPIGLDFENEVEAEVCKFYPQECFDCSPLVPNTAIRLSIDDVVAGTKTMLRFKLAGSPLVDQAEADRRAAICSKCAYNGQITTPCSGCDAIKKAVISLIGDVKTAYDDRLQSCMICHCFNAAAVWLPLEIQSQSWREIQKQQFQAAKESNSCWKG